MRWLKRYGGFLLVGLLLYGFAIAQPAEQRIINASGARVRATPQAGAATVEILPLGTVVEQLGRSGKMVQIGAKADYWYEVGLPSGKSGWIFGSLTAGFEAPQRDRIFLAISRERERMELGFPELIELSNFLERAAREAMDPESAGELALAHLLALRGSLQTINQLPFGESEQPPYSTWVQENQDKGYLDFSEPAAEFLVRGELFRLLHERYYPLSIADRIAWALAQNPWVGECEGHLGCYLYWLEVGPLRYLKYHPAGQYRGEAIGVIADFFDSEFNYEVYPEDQADLRRQFAVILATLARVDAPEIGDLSERIERFRDSVERRLPASG